jgi:hypothetical protein
MKTSWNQLLFAFYQYRLAISSKQKKLDLSIYTVRVGTHLQKIIIFGGRDYTFRADCMWLCIHVQVAVCPPAEFSYISCPFILVHVAVYPHAHDLVSICMYPCIHVNMHPKKVQFKLSKKPGRMGIHNHETGTTFPSQGISFLYIIFVRYHSGGSMKLNARIWFLAHMVYL